MNDEIYFELARRLCAAYISYFMRLKSIDYVLKKYVPKDISQDISQEWIKLAKNLCNEREDI